VRPDLKNRTLENHKGCGSQNRLGG